MLQEGFKTFSRSESPLPSLTGLMQILIHIIKVNMGIQFLKLNAENELVGVEIEDQAAPISSLLQTIFRKATKN